VGRLAKAAERRQGHRRHLDLVAPTKPSKAATVPVAPDGVSLATRKMWREFWASRMAWFIETVDMPTLRHLFRLYDERDRSYRAYRKCPYVKGSKGQPVINPILKQARAFESEIRRLEDRFGISPWSRQRMGIPVGKQKSLEDLNHDLDDSDDDDPRA